MLDLIIRGAQVHDGLGHPPVKADVAIHQGRVTQIGEVTEPAQEVVDATGLSLMPGIGTNSSRLPITLRLPPRTSPLASRGPSDAVSKPRTLPTPPA